MGDLDAPHRSKRWVVNGDFGRFSRARQDRWVFGDRTCGVRRQLVTSVASPDDPALADYWAAQRIKMPPPADRHGQPAPLPGPARPLRVLFTAGHVAAAHVPGGDIRSWKFGQA